MTIKVINKSIDSARKFETAIDDVHFFTTTKEITMEQDETPEIEPTTEEVLSKLEICDDLAMLHNEIATVRDRIKAEDRLNEYYYEVFRALTKVMAEIDLVQK